MRKGVTGGYTKGHYELNQEGSMSKNSNRGLDGYRYQ